MKKIVVNTDGCIGCGACFGLDPEHFEPNEDGYSTVKNEEVTNLELVQEVISTCPVGVISIEETENDNEKAA